MRKGFPICLLAWSFVTCAPRISTTPYQKPAVDPPGLEVSHKPDWVVTKPVKEGYFVGLGSAKTHQPDYQRIAKEKALEDMLTEIRVMISATSFLYQKEFGEHFSERYETFIKTSSLEELSEFEVLNNWSDGSEYWVAYGLSKWRYRELKKEKVTAALISAIEHVQNARSHEKNGRFLGAIHSHLKAVDAMKKYLDEPLVAKIGTKEQPVIPYCWNAIQGILNDLKVGEGEIQFSPMQREPQPITFYCRDVAAKGFSFTGANRKFTANQGGQIFMDMETTATQSMITLTVTKDMLKSFGKDSFVLKEFINSLTFPKFNIPVSILPIAFYVEGEEFNLGARSTRSSVRSAVINSLSAYRFVFNENPQGADFRLTYNVSTRQGQETNGLYVCWADVEISFYDSSNDLIYSDQLLNVKGIHTSYHAAGMKAIENVAPLLKEKIIQPLIKSVF